MSASQDTGHSAGPENPAEGAKPPAHVLVVDDDQLIRTLLENMLANAGYTVVLAENGRDALARLRAHPVQVVVTDMLMPEMNGLELIAVLRAIHPELPVIGMSGGSTKSDTCLERARELGASSTLAKPFQRQQILDAVARALRRSIH